MGEETAMKWRALGDDGRYPSWMAEAGGKSGVYAIRLRSSWLWFGGPVVVYVGESHTGNLRKTLTRHFQSWRRAKQWWAGAYASKETDPGHTYRRTDVDVAFQVATPARAVELQSEWIRKLKPRDNVALLEEPPF